jgi:hypothetical protein
MSIEDLATRTSLPKKNFRHLYHNKEVRTLKGPGRSKRFHVEDVRKTLNGHGDRLGPLPPAPASLKDLVTYEVLGVKLNVKTKEQAFDAIAKLVS